MALASLVVATDRMVAVFGMVPGRSTAPLELVVPLIVAVRILLLIVDVAIFIWR